MSISTTSHQSEKTLPLTVGNTAFLLDRMGGDCHPLQFLRELTQNAIEAILRTEDQSGEIIWDVDWNVYELEGVYKLCVTDTGDGMTGDEMVKYINKLSSSVSKQSLKGNYGVGAKIAAATKNHEGLIYQSWVEGEGSMIHLWKDPTTDEYGLRQMKKPDGSFGHFAEIEDSVKPEIIGGSGTKVILLGNSEEESTMNPPEGAASPSIWISRYLNTRYFRFPEGVTVRAREGWTNPREDTDRNVLRRIMGQAEYLEKHKIESGSVRLSHATAHWWILKDEKALSSNSGYIESKGHVAALYNNELYEMESGRAGMARLQEFGVIMGYRQVVIYVEPRVDGQKPLTTNTARTNLLLGNESLPWSEWAAEFREKMPDKIEAHIESVAKGSSSKDHKETIRDRLKEILSLYKVSRYRPVTTGDFSIDEEVTARGGIPKRQDQDRSKSSSKHSSGKKGGTAGGVYSVFLKKNGTQGEKVQPDPFPDVRWVSVEDRTREPGDMEDRAAKFLVDQNLLLINKDFRVFADMINHWCEVYQPSVRPTVENVVQGWFEQALTETVIGVQALQNAREWSVDDVKKALSEEALTASVMPRYHVNYSVKRELGSKLGKAQAA